MKFKITWPIGIVMAILLFMGYILSFVYKAMVSPEYDHHLVTENYYQKELKYQSEIDKQKRALKLTEDIAISKNEKGLLIIFPKQFQSEKITGTIEFLRLSDEKADLILPIIIKNHQLLVEDKKLIKGKYRLIIDWEAEGKTYMFKEEITY